MTNNRKFAKAAILRRTTAIIVTVLFHVAVIGALTYGSEDSLTDKLPEFVQNWLNDSPKEAVAETELP